MNEQKQVEMSPELAAKNKRLAIILAFVALAFYIGFIFIQADK